MLCRLTAHSADRDALDPPPLAEVGESGLFYVGGGRLSACGRRGQKALGKGLYVDFADAPAGAGSGHTVNVDPQFTRQSTHMRGGRDWPAMFDSGRAVQIEWHGEGGHRCSAGLV